MVGNTVCDPAQAFPLGPFTTDRCGCARFTTTAPAPAAVDVGNAGTVSVRIGDDATDQDGDGFTGPIDVVAVPGQPSIGLVECSTRPCPLVGEVLA